MSNKYELTGIIRQIGDTQTIGEKGFQKREFIVEEIDGKYPQTIKLEATKDGCDKLDAYKVGDSITVGFNIRGSEYKGKYYVNLQAWKFDREGQSSSKPIQSAHNQAKANGYQKQDEDVDDIPF